MKKVKIGLVTLGHSGNLFDERQIKNWKSDVFEVVTIHRIENLPQSEVVDQFLDQKFDTEQLGSILRCPDDCDLVVGVMAYRFIDNFYMHRINGKCAVVSLSGISDILSKNHISMENFIIKQLYGISAIKLVFSDLSTNEVYSFVHLDTRGCLFDLNGDKQDIVHNTEKPRICDECKGKLGQRQIERESILKFEKELRRISKRRLLEIELFIRMYPLLSVLTSALVAITLNIVASALWEILKTLLESQRG